MTKCAMPMKNLLPFWFT